MVLGDIVDEVTTEPAIVAFAEARPLGIQGRVEIADGEALLAEDVAQGVPGEIDGTFLGLGIPIARLAEKPLAVGAEVIGLLRRLLRYLIGGAELEAGMLRVAVDVDLPVGRVEAGGEFDERAAGDVVDGQLALLFGKDIGLVAVPVEKDAVAAEDGAGGALQLLDMGDVGPLVQCQVSACLLPS
jgi:hypothetical protein